jgi:hypothetical protein
MVLRSFRRQVFWSITILGLSLGLALADPADGDSHSAAAAGARSSEENLTLAQGGPPSHAPAHGYRAKYHYRYYPGASVYYDAGRRIWFYIKAGDWTFGASLPAGLKAQLGEHVAIGMDEDKPYVRNAEHAAQYPPEKYKKRK